MGVKVSVSISHGPDECALEKYPPPKSFLQEMSHPASCEASLYQITAGMGLGESPLARGT